MAGSSRFFGHVLRHKWSAAFCQLGLTPFTSVSNCCLHLHSLRVDLFFLGHRVDSADRLKRGLDVFKVTFRSERCFAKAGRVNGGTRGTTKWTSKYFICFTLYFQITICFKRIFKDWLQIRHPACWWWFMLKAWPWPYLPFGNAGLGTSKAKRKGGQTGVKGACCGTLSSWRHFQRFI